MTAFVFLLLWSSPADACSCVPPSAELYVEGADAIYVAKSVSYSESKGKSSHRFRVLDTLKGKRRGHVAATWMLSPCPPEHERKKGAGALLFMKKGRLLSMCSGNIYLEHLGTIAFDLIRTLGGNKGTPTMAQTTEAAMAGVPGAKPSDVRIVESLALGRTTIIRMEHMKTKKAFVVLLVDVMRRRSRRLPGGKQGPHKQYQYPEVVHVWHKKGVSWE